MGMSEAKRAAKSGQPVERRPHKADQAHGTGTSRYADKQRRHAAEALEAEKAPATPSNGNGHIHHAAKHPPHASEPASSPAASVTNGNGQGSHAARVARPTNGLGLKIGRSQQTMAASDEPTASRRNFRPPYRTVSAALQGTMDAGANGVHHDHGRAFVPPARRDKTRQALNREISQPTDFADACIRKMRLDNVGGFFGRWQTIFHTRITEALNSDEFRQLLSQPNAASRFPSALNQAVLAQAVRVQQNPLNRDQHFFMLHPHHNTNIAEQPSYRLKWEIAGALNVFAQECVRDLAPRYLATPAAGAAR